MKFLSQEKFKKWLKSKHPRTRVGNLCMCCCPIAKFILQTTGKSASVNYDVISVKDRTPAGRLLKVRQYSLPKWAKGFIEKVDEGSGSSVSASKCLSLLAEIR